jgi:AP-2 complex subunit alpha
LVLQGYVACSLLLSEHQDLLRLIIQAIKNDLAGKNEVFQSLALVCVANVGGQEFAEALAPDVQKLLVAGASRSFVRKKAALCLLRMFRKYPDIMAAESWAPRVLNLLEDKHLGVVTSVLSLLLGLVARDRNGYEEAVPKAIRLLGKLVLAKECDKDYTYYKTPSPWVQVKLLRLLQHFPPPKDKQLRERLDEVIMNILTRTEVTKSVW